MHVFRTLLLGFVALALAGTASAAISSGSTSFNGKSVHYTFTGDEVSALSYAKDGTCRVTATVDGETHRVVISDDRLQWNEASVALDGFKTVKIVMGKTDARFTVDGQVVKVAPTAIGKVE